MLSYSKIILLVLLTFIFTAAGAQVQYPTASEGFYNISNFRFSTNERISQLKLHYLTIGAPHRGRDGKVDNAVLIMHGTTSQAKNFLSNTFAGQLFGPGQILDVSKYFIILPDAIGHGKSSKPSDGLHMKFPKYTYDDMVNADYLLLTEHLNVDHLRLILGTSMGAMESWMFGYLYPDFADALVPLASLPTEIAGRNRMMRKMAIDMIEQDPEWKGGEYTTEPKLGLRGAISSFIFMNSSALQFQKIAPTREKAEAFLERTETANLNSLDANDVIYTLDASRFYNPDPYLEKIKAPVLAINSADDEINPPELGIMEKEIKRVPKGRFILLPITDQTWGHGTNSMPAVWGNYLKEFMQETEKK